MRGEKKKKKSQKGDKKKSMIESYIFQRSKRSFLYQYNNIVEILIEYA